MSELGVGENCKAGKCVGGVATKMGFPIRLQERLLVEHMWLTEKRGRENGISRPHSKKMCLAK